MSQAICNKCNIEFKEPIDVCKTCRLLAQASTEYWERWVYDDCEPGPKGDE